MTAFVRDARGRFADPALPPLGVSRYEDAATDPPAGMRFWICEVDNHADPDNSGLCIHCAAVTDGDEESG